MSVLRFAACLRSKQRATPRTGSASAVRLVPGHQLDLDLLLLVGKLHARILLVERDELPAPLVRESGRRREGQKHAAQRGRGETANGERLADHYGRFHFFEGWSHAFATAGSRVGGSRRYRRDVVIACQSGKRMKPTGRTQKDS